MLWKELVDLEDCDLCPLKKEDICKGGWSSDANGMPVEPPCTMFEDDTDLDQWITDYYANYARWAAEQDRQIRERAKKRRQAEKAAETRKQIKYYCYTEIANVKKVKAEICKLEKLITGAKQYIDTVNATNALFRNIENIPADYKLYVDFIEKANVRMSELQTQLTNAEEVLKQKRKEFYANRKVGGCNYD